MTLVVPVRDRTRVCDLARAGLDSVAVRVPGHAQARAVLEDIGTDAVKTGMLGSVESTSATESSSRRTRDPGG